jgi:hypothetical protein
MFSTSSTESGTESGTVGTAAGTREDAGIGTGTGPRAGDGGPSRREQLGHSLRPLLIDVALPIGGYYLLSAGFGVATVPALAVAAVPPAISVLVAAVRQRRLNALAGLILLVNAAGIAASAITGDPRLMIAKDGLVSSVIGLVLLGSVAVGRPLMSTVIRPIAVRDDPMVAAAWDKLAAGSSAFRRAEAGYSTVWGLCLLAECAARVIGAYTLPVSTMVWLHSVFLGGAILLGFVLGRPFIRRMVALLKAEGRPSAG